MRETRLHDYASLRKEEGFNKVDITLPVPSPDSIHTNSPPTFAGLISETITWRVESSSALVFESIYTQAGLRINFSSPLTCRPLFLSPSTGDNSVILIASCHADRNGCTLISLKLAFNPTSATGSVLADELGRLLIPGICITELAEIGSDVIVGLCDGHCAHLHHFNDPSRKIELYPITPSSSWGARRESGAGDTTSMVSLATSDSAPSRRSVASSISLGLMSRLFRSPRGNSATPGYTDGMRDGENQTVFSSGRLRDTLSMRGAARDKVLALAEMDLEGTSFVSLHQSGRVCAFSARDGGYHFMGDIVLPMKLSTGSVDHFLLSGLSSSVVAVVMVDEDPCADSLRIYSLTAKLRPNRTAVLSCTQIAKREGPFDRIVSAVFTGEDVVIGTDSGFLSATINIPADVDSGAGMPVGTIWTAMDDVDKPFGFGRSMDDALPSPRAHLGMAHRFSPYAIAKALRFDDLETITREEVQSSLKSIEYGEDEENKWKRVQTRAEQVSKFEDLKIRDVRFVKSVGIIVARQKSLFVLRKLSASERNAIGSSACLVDTKSGIAKGRLARLLSSHAICQELAARYITKVVPIDYRPNLIFMLGLCIRFSESRQCLPLTDVLVERSPGMFAVSAGSEALLDFDAALDQALSILEPGRKLLETLLASSEMEALGIAAEQSANIVPISSMFANGVSWLAQYRKISLTLRLRTGAEETQEELIAETSDRCEEILEKAYGFLITAAQWCDNEEAGGHDDVQCAIGLAGLAGNIPHSGTQTTTVREGEMTDADPPVPFGLPNGPSEVGRKDLGFWLLERSVRLLESSGAPKSAAAAALVAMERAPNRERHEMMRAAAFSRFLDAGELNFALTAILKEPYSSSADMHVATEESKALWDSIGLFVNATADCGMLQWLADYDLPEPLCAFCGQALERRARAADSFSVRDLLKSRSNFDEQEHTSESEEEHTACPYEQLYAWYVLRADFASAATAALEWVERLSFEGPGIIRNTLGGLPVVSADQQVRLLLAWTKSKSEALAYASATIQIYPPEEQYIPRTRFSLLAHEDTDAQPGVVDLSWLSRRHLLAQTQKRCLTQILSENEGTDVAEEDMHYLLAEGSPFLAEREDGVRWAVSMLSKKPSYDNLLLCIELACSWIGEISDKILIEVVESAAGIAAQKEITSFEYPHLRLLLQAVFSTQSMKHPAPNWYLLALDSALSSSLAGAPCPQWLVNAAAWGILNENEANTESQCYFAGRGRGDAIGVVRAFLRYHRPIEAAKVLSLGLECLNELELSDGLHAAYVSYATIDSTIEMLAQVADESEDAENCRKRLAELADHHMRKMTESLSRCTKTMTLETDRIECNSRDLSNHADVEISGGSDDDVEVIEV